MSISSSANSARLHFTATSGQTAFSVSFEFFDNADLDVYVNGTQKTITTHYSVSGGDGSTGTVTFNSGLTLNDAVTITRRIDIERVTDFSAGQAINRAALNTQLDTLTAISSDNKDRAERSLRAPDDENAPTMTLPSLTSRKGTVLGFNATSGNVEAGPKIADVSTLAAVTADIATLADIEDGTDATDAIQTVAGIASNVSTVAGVSSAVSTVAGISSNVTAVAADATDIGVVAGKITEIGRLGTAQAVADLDILATTDAVSDMNTLAAISSNISTVAGISANVTSVAGVASLITSDFVADLNTLATTDIVSDLNTLATADIVSDLNTLATSDIVSDLNTLATADIVSDLNTLATSDIVSDLNTLATTDIVTDLNLLATSAIVEDLNLLATSTVIADMATLAGSGANPNISSLGVSGNITLADNGKAIFGAGSDLQIYHDGSNSYIKDAGTGNLNVQAENLALENTSGDNYLVGVNGSFTKLYFSGSEKLATTSTGVDITGAVTANGFQADTSNTNYNLIARNSSNVAAYIQNGGSGPVLEARSGNMSAGQGDLHLKIENNGDISFYEDTGTTAKFFWDASAESLGIGTSSPSSKLELVGTGFTDSTIRLQRTDSGENNDAGLQFTANAGENSGHGMGGIWFKNSLDSNAYALIRARTDDATGTSGRLDFITSTSSVGNTTAPSMRITSAGNVGIGVTSLNIPLEVKGRSSDGRFFRGQNNGGTDFVDIGHSGSLAFIDVTHSGGAFHDFAINTGGSERMRIDSSGRVLIGHTSSIPIEGGNQNLQLIGTTSQDGLSIARFNADFGPYLNFGRSGSGTIGNYTAVPNGDELGRIQWAVADGTDMNSVGASISAFTEQTAASNDVPSRLVFKTTADGASSPTERMRIDSSGHVTIGNTSTTPWSLSSGSGAVIRSEGYAGFAASSAAIELNRVGSDGNIANFRKDGTAVGSIGVSGTNNLYISGEAANHAGLTFATQSVLPTTQGAANNNTVDLGQNGNAYKDLWLGGGIYLGGTGSANKLEDYEEGTFIVGFGSGHTGSITIDDNYKTGKYTKIGNTVTFTIHIRTTAVSSPAGILDITGLPFATPNNTEFRHTFGPCVFFNFTGMTNGDYPVAYLSNNTSTISFALTNTNSIQNFPANRITASSEFYVTGTYFV